MVYVFDKFDVPQFIVMEYVEGKPLRDLGTRINKGGAGKCTDEAH
jgi:tRNA A-37 threonylcarbamoyl transferase component Bud32